MKLWHAIVLGIVCTWAGLGAIIGAMVAVNSFGLQSVAGYLTIGAIISLVGAMIGSNWWNEKNSDYDNTIAG
jgi:hypothetical protein